MNRRDLFRHSLFGAVGAAALSQPVGTRELPPNASKELAKPDWKPKFLDAHQNETLILMSETIIPATDTPGGKDALVNRFLDLLISAESHDVQRKFIGSLSYIDGESASRFKKAFIHLSPQERTDFMHWVAYPHTLDTWTDAKRSEFAGTEHFTYLKSWISKAYYNSEAGMRELGWDGGPPHGEFTGCEHAAEQTEKHEHSPATHSSKS